MTAEQLFLRYAYPCVHAKEVMGKISPKHSQELTTWVLEEGNPTRRRLKFCFPHAFRALRALAQTQGRETWSLVNVQDYWHNHHDREGDCATQLVTILVINNKTVTVNNGVDELAMVNLYGLSLQVGDRVYTHQRCVVEIIA